MTRFVGRERGEGEVYSVYLVQLREFFVVAVVAHDGEEACSLGTWNYWLPLSLVSETPRTPRRGLDDGVHRGEQYRDAAIRELAAYCPRIYS